MAIRADISRRTALTVPAAMILGAGVCAAEEDGCARPSSKTLVAVFTRSGNTRVIAGQLQRALGADLFEIQPAQPYPEDYEQTVEQARRERDSGFEPALKATVPNIAAYETLFLGFPIWGETAPRPSAPSCRRTICRASQSAPSSPMGATASGAASRSCEAMHLAPGSSTPFPWRPTRSGAPSIKSRPGSARSSACDRSRIGEHQ